MPDPLFQPPFQLAPQNLLLFISLFLMERAIASAVRRRQLLAALALIVSSIMSRQCALHATLSVEEAVQLVAIQLPVVLASVVTLSDLTEAPCRRRRRACRSIIWRPAHAANHIRWNGANGQYWNDN